MTSQRYNVVQTVSSLNKHIFYTLIEFRLNI